DSCARASSGEKVSAQLTLTTQLTTRTNFGIAMRVPRQRRERESEGTSFRDVTVAGRLCEVWDISVSPRYRKANELAVAGLSPSLGTIRARRVERAIAGGRASGYVGGSGSRSACRPGTTRNCRAGSAHFCTQRQPPPCHPRRGAPSTPRLL